MGKLETYTWSMAWSRGLWAARTSGGYPQFQPGQHSLMPTGSGVQDVSYCLWAWDIWGLVAFCFSCSCSRITAPEQLSLSQPSAASGAVGASEWTLGLDFMARIPSIVPVLQEEHWKKAKKNRQTCPHQGYITAFNLHSCYYQMHFTDEAIEIQKGYVPCLWPHS